MSGFAPEHVTINGEAGELPPHVGDQESPVERRAVGSTLHIVACRNEVYQNLIGGDAAGKRQRAIELVGAVAGYVNHHILARRSVDGERVAIAYREGR